ncbi:hypothetical protein MUK42_07397 [Musa troglodytarum]|uniref:Uncharacterized protein n=1 Tax=Musa troglodytarum TaxID=320322 RepID=A0A9E7EK91_9LILI|nr:hypothetical protein MUK42_07397 [Musa troglodytarum]
MLATPAFLLFTTSQANQALLQEAQDRNKKIIASFVSSTAASEHVASPPPPSPSPATSSSSPPPCRHILAMSQAVSLLTTSHSPSLARIRHSSPSSLSNTLTSGSGITYGFK